MENEIYLISQSCPPRRCQVIPSPQMCRVTLPRKDLILCTRRNPEIVLDIATYVIDKGQSVYAQRYCTNDLHGALNDVVLCGFSWFFWDPVSSWIWGSGQWCHGFEYSTQWTEMDFVSYGNLVQWHQWQSASFYIILEKRENHYCSRSLGSVMFWDQYQDFSNLTH